MAVIVVGDFNKAAIEAQIKSRFGAIPAPSSPRPKPMYTRAESARHDLLGDHRP